MKVNVHAVNFSVDRKLVGFVQERMDKLESIMIRLFFCLFKVEKTSDKRIKLQR
jgi:putative sigma-54 modulation protein